MRNRTQKFLLIFLALALAVAPLRGAFALPASAPADGTSHCEQMQAEMQSSGHMAAMQDAAVSQSKDTRDSACEQGCGGDCCDGACNACAHASMALSSTLTVASDNFYAPLNIIVSYGVSGRSIHPPFRPPISLPS